MAKANVGTVLVPHGTTPTGYGIRYRSNGSLRALSKCCGRSMEYAKKGGSTLILCKGCKEDYYSDETMLHAALANDLSVKNSEAVREVFQAWARQVTGYTDLVLEFS